MLGLFSLQLFYCLLLLSNPPLDLSGDWCGKESKVRKVDVILVQTSAVLSRSSLLKFRSNFNTDLLVRLMIFRTQNVKIH